MAKKIGRIVGTAVLIVVLLGVLAVLLTPVYLQRSAGKSFPTVDGELQAPGLDGPVEIYRDGYGVPHIYASTHHDLFFAQGYVHAQDRFWQMDFWRHLGAGRLSELIGKPMLESDQFIRTLGWERTSRQELELLGPQEIDILEAYAGGVNAYLAGQSPSELSLEYQIIGLINREYEPAPWTPLNSLTWGKAMAWDLRGNLDTEIERAQLLKSLPRGRVEFLYPAYPADHPLIVPDFLDANQDQEETSGRPGQEAGQINWTAALPLLSSFQEGARSLDLLTGGGFEGIGSNSWAVHGDLTNTGKPYLANDPHLAAQIPSIWYEAGLHCQEKTEDCQLDVAGFSFAGVPGIIIGHNDQIAWGFTNTGPDVMDLYIEQLHPEHPTQYLTPDGWVEMEQIVEIIEIAGEEPVEHTVYLSSHGPVIESVYGLEDFHKTTSLSLPAEYALALRWTALEPSCVFCSIWKINLAGSWDEFRDAARDFSVPAQNLIYADVEGNIGYQMPGKIPIRINGHDGMLPVAGWNGEYDWQGYIPFDELPYSLNPSRGYIVTANNAVVGLDYPYLITGQWSQGFRARRIVELLESDQGPINLADIKRMQGDNYDTLAQDIVPLLLGIRFEDEDLIQAQDLLRGWDYQADLDSAPAALYQVFWQNLVNNTIQDNLPESFHLGVDSTAKEVIRLLLVQPDDPWWNDPSTPERENLESIFRLTLEESFQELSRSLGRDPGEWRWGALHTITFQHQVLSGFPLINKSFNRGPFETSGGSEIINATGWDPAQPYLVDWLPSMRMIIDLSDLTNSLSVNTTGQSGHAYHSHYQDQVELWRKVYYHPLLWDRDQIQRQAESLLILRP